jgi:hypothetical protein
LSEAVPKGPGKVALLLRSFSTDSSLGSVWGSVPGELAMLLRIPLCGSAARRIALLLRRSLSDLTDLSGVIESAQIELMKVSIVHTIMHISNGCAS